VKAPVVGAGAAPGPGGAPLNMPIEVREVGSAPDTEAMTRIDGGPGAPDRRLRENAAMDIVRGKRLERSDQ
jgi:hypothetical protein